MWTNGRITGLSVDIDEARTARRAGDGTLPSDGHSRNQELPALTFAQLKELIELGKTDEIPNNKIIPDGLNVCDSTVHGRFVAC